MESELVKLFREVFELVEHRQIYKISLHQEDWNKKVIALRTYIENMDNRLNKLEILINQVVKEDN